MSYSGAPCSQFWHFPFWPKDCVYIPKARLIGKWGPGERFHPITLVLIEAQGFLVDIPWDPECSPSFSKQSRCIACPRHSEGGCSANSWVAYSRVGPVLYKSTEVLGILETQPAATRQGEYRTVLSMR